MNTDSIKSVDESDVVMLDLHKFVQLGKLVKHSICYPNGSKFILNDSHKFTITHPREWKVPSVIGSAAFTMTQIGHHGR